MKQEVQNVSAAKFEEIAAALKARTGLALVGNEGTVEKKGFAVRYRYDPEARTLLLELLKKPWFVPQSLIDSKLAEFMQKDGQAFLERPPADEA